MKQQISAGEIEDCSCQSDAPDQRRDGGRGKAGWMRFVKVETLQTRLLWHFVAG